MSSEAAQRHDVMHAIHHRRAVRAYTPETLGENAIRELLDAAVHAPTAMHAEPWAFVVVQNKALLDRLSNRAKTMQIAELARDGDSPPPDAAVRGRLLDMLQDPSFNIFYDAGTLIVICRDAQGPYAEADCWLAAENLMLAAYARSLGTCCIGFAIPILNVPDVKNEIGIPDGVTAVAPVIVGYARGPVPDVPRKAPRILRWVK